jgi:hypothetical protein
MSVNTENFTVTLGRAELSVTDDIQCLDWRSLLSCKAQQTINLYQHEGWQVQKVVTKTHELTIHFAKS